MFAGVAPFASPNKQRELFLIVNNSLLEFCFEGEPLGGKTQPTSNGLQAVSIIGLSIHLHTTIMNPNIVENNEREV